MTTAEFLALIKMKVIGVEEANAKIDSTQKTLQKLASTKIKTFYDKEGMATGAQIEQTFKDIAPAASTAANKMGDFEKAIRRVVVVAPVWMAFRAVLQGTFSLLSDGFRTWEEFDKALTKSQAVVHGYAGTTKQAIKELEDTMVSFSKETGVSLTDLTSAFYRFGTVGIPFSDAMGGAIASAELAKATFADVDTIARSLAMAYRLLGDTIDSSLSPMEKQESLAGKIFHLWKTNAFETNEFAQSLNAFVSTANMANFTADQTVSTLAALGTAGVMGARGGTLLKTAIQKLVENLDKLAPKLGLAVNPVMENTFDVFMRVLGAINELSKTTGIPAEALKAIQEIFGGTRGAQVISALNALLPELKKNLEDLGKDPQEFIKGLHDRVQDVTQTVGGQLDIFRRLREEVGRAFVMGITGADDFKNALLKINQAMEGMISVAGNVGSTVFDMVHPLESARIYSERAQKAMDEYADRFKKAITGAAQLKDIIILIAELETRQTKEKVDYSETIKNLKEIATNIAINGKQKAIEAAEAKKVTEENQKIADSEKEQQENLNNLKVDLQTKIKLSKEDAKYTELQKEGISEVQIAYSRLNDIILELVDRNNKLVEAGGKLTPQLDAIVLRTELLAGNYEKVVSSLSKIGLTQEDINRIVTTTVNYNKALVVESDKLVDNELELLKIRGGSTIELLKAEAVLKSMFFANYDVRKDEELRLKLQKEITKEQRNQISLSNETVQLYKIAKTQGIEAARQIGSFLTGKTTFAELRNMPRIFDLFKKYFPQQAEAFSAAEFMGIPFKGFGQPGAGRVNYATGAQIPLQGEINIKELKREVQAKFDVGNINISLQKSGLAKEDKETVLKDMLDKLSSEITDNPELRSALETIIEEY